MPFISKLLVGIGIIVIAGLGYMGLHYAGTQQFGAFNPTGSGTYLLQSSISSSQTSITLTSFTEPGSNIPYTMTYLNSDIEYGTISPSSGNSEFISFTGITQNASQSATLTGVTRGLARTPGNTGCVASTTLAHAYPGQTQLILSNSPCFYSEYAVKRNTQTISGRWTFDVYPEASSTIGTATTSRQFLTLGQAQSIATQGAATGTESVAGIVRLGTAAQAASSTDLGVDIPLVLQTKYASSSPSAVCGFCVVVSQLGGKISQAWLDLTQAFTFSGLVAFSNTGTTTFSGGIESGTKIAAPYFIATSTTATSTFTKISATCLSQGGTYCNGTYPIYVNGALNLTSAASATTTLLTIAIPAGTLSTSNFLRVKSYWNGGPSCYSQVDIGSGSATTTALYGFNGTGALQDMEITIMASSSTSVYGTGFSFDASIPISTPITAATTYYGAFGAGLTLANVNYLDFRVRNSIASDCNLKGVTIERVSN